MKSLLRRFLSIFFFYRSHKSADPSANTTALSAAFPSPVVATDEETICPTDVATGKKPFYSAYQTAFGTPQEESYFSTDSATSRQTESAPYLSTGV